MLSFIIDFLNLLYQCGLNTDTIIPFQASTLQQSRLANLPNGGSSTLRLNNSAYASQQQIGMPRPPQTVTIPSIRQSPLIGDRAGSVPRYGIFFKVRRETTPGKT